MYTSEDVNTAALYSLHYNGRSHKNRDSQEQLEYEMAKIGFAAKPEKECNKISNVMKNLLSFIKSSFSRSAIQSQQCNASAHL